MRDQLGEVHATTLSRRDEDVKAITSHGIAYHKLSHNADDQSLIKPFFLGFELARLVRELKPDLIHVFTLKAMCVGAIACLLANRSAVLMSVTGLGYMFTSRAIKARFWAMAVFSIMPRLLKRSADLFVCQNPDDLAIFHDRFRIGHERLHLIRGSGVDISRYTILPEKSGLPTVMFVSRMLRDKGVVEFVEAARRLKLEGLGARFVLVGETDTENPSAVPESQVREWHESGVIEWWGYSYDMLATFSEAHVVCLPSYREGAPKVLIEAASCGKPIVTTDVPGCREVVRHTWNGLLVPPKDSSALAEALRTLIRDPQLRKSMGQNGRTLVERELSLEKVINENFKLYEKLLVKQRGVALVPSLNRMM